MAHCWIGTKTTWRPRPLGASRVALASLADAGDGSDDREVASWGDAELVRIGVGDEAWALVATSPALRLNGAPVDLGLALIADRDEIRAGRDVVWFSTETLPTIGVYPATHGQCPRCKRAIEQGRPAVRCPNCGVWHHQDDEREICCWTYSAACASCGHQTKLDAGYQWTPEEL